MSDCSPANRERELVLDRGETLRFRKGFHYVQRITAGVKNVFL